MNGTNDDDVGNISQNVDIDVGKVVAENEDCGQDMSVECNYCGEIIIDNEKTNTHFGICLLTKIDIEEQVAIELDLEKEQQKKQLEMINKDMEAVENEIDAEFDGIIKQDFKRFKRLINKKLQKKNKKLRMIDEMIIKEMDAIENEFKVDNMDENDDNDKIDNATDEVQVLVENDNDEDDDEVSIIQPGTSSSERDTRVMKRGPGRPLGSRNKPKRTRDSEEEEEEDSSCSKKKRPNYCRTCQTCKLPDCGHCKYCLDKSKNGGANKLRKRCENKPCEKQEKKTR